jgi:hypothetical protein
MCPMKEINTNRPVNGVGTILDRVVNPVATAFNPLKTESESYITTDSQSASLSWNKAPIWGLRTDIYLSLTITAMFLWASSLTRGRV